MVARLKNFDLKCLGQDWFLSVKTEFLRDFRSRNEFLRDFGSRGIRGQIPTKINWLNSQETHQIVWESSRKFWGCMFWILENIFLCIMKWQR